MGREYGKNGKKIRRAVRREGEERSDEEGPQKLPSTKQEEREIKSAPPATSHTTKIPAQSKG